MPIRKNTLPSREYLCQRFIYMPECGILIWRLRDGDSKYIKIWNTSWAGKEAFTKNNGYIRGTIDGISTSAHRIIWKMMTGEEPDFIDHINRDRSDNRWENLRSVPKVENEHNAPRPNTNSSGHVGVSFEAYTNKWRAEIWAYGEHYRLGRYENLQDAINARDKAEIKYWGELRAH